MKRTILLILTVSILIVCTAMPVGAERQLVLNLSMPCSVATQETFDCTISVDPTQANGGILTLNFNLQYDTALLTFVSASCSDPDSWLFLSNCKNGTVRLYSEAPFGSEGYYDPITADGALVYTLTFRSNTTSTTATIATTGFVTGTQTVNTELIYGNSLSAQIGIADTHQIYFDAGLGTNAPDPVIKYHGVPLTLPDTVPVRGGYDFAGWMVYPSDSVSYQPGDTVTAESDMILTACWIPRSISSVSDDAAVDGDYLYLPDSLTAEQASALLRDSDSIAFYNANYETAADEMIGTGYHVMLWGEGAQTALDELTVVVMGDLNGNGQCESNDCALIRNRFLNGPDLGDAPCDLACDFNGNGKADSNDYIRVRMRILGIDG